MDEKPTNNLGPHGSHDLKPGGTGNILLKMKNYKKAFWHWQKSVSKCIMGSIPIYCIHCYKIDHNGSPSCDCADVIHLESTLHGSAMDQPSQVLSVLTLFLPMTKPLPLYYLLDYCY